MSNPLFALAGRPSLVIKRYFHRARASHQRLAAFLLLTLVSLGGLSACSNKDAQRLEIMTNAWIGFSPLFYAKEQGWLDELNIKLSTVVSLGENVHIYLSADKDAFTGTQHEFQQAQRQQPDLVPVVLFDRSNGGDMVMSNVDLATLQNARQPIDVYLELDTVNKIVFEDFVKQNALQNKAFNFINRDQVKIVTSLQNQQATPPSIAVTYIPYNFDLQKQGFKTLASTADNLDLLVVDALYTRKSTLQQHRAQFEGLKQAIAKALQALQTDPQSYYNHVKPYLSNTSYNEFMASLHDIQWLDGELSPALIERFNQAQLPIRDLM